MEWLKLGKAHFVLLPNFLYVGSSKPWRRVGGAEIAMRKEEGQKAKERQGEEKKRKKAEGGRDKAACCAV